MNEEIKELLKDLKIDNAYYKSQKHDYAFPDYYSLNYEDLDIILNYITNLQEENCKLKETNEEHRKINGDLRKENQKLVNVIEELLEDSDMMLKSLNYNSKNGIEIVQYKLANIINKLTELKGDNNA